MSHKLIGFSHLVTVSVTERSKARSAIMCHRLRNKHWDWSGHMSPPPDDPTLKRQYQLEQSFAVITERRTEFQAAAFVTKAREVSP